MEKKVDVKKILSVTKTVLIWVVFAISISMMVFTLISSLVLGKTDRGLFGYKFFIVLSDSMSATDFDAGDIIFSKTVDLKDLEEGDIITFISQNKDNWGETVTHKIRRVTRDDDGQIAFVTYGTTTNTDDEALATMIVGQYVGRIPKLGHFFSFLKTTPGYIVCILIPFLILILSQAINFIRLFRAYKAEQMAAMKAEREQIENEREENKKMMEELLALKAQLEAQGAQEPLASSSEAPENQDAP